ncbi:MAG: diaminopimelate decarboxylase [Tannerella sp.]|jgi:diaminopimelate decarboxylase|nr:diaminopimelate decarboxylase [Tannerella sp.]
MKGIFPTDRFGGLRTPFYYYDIELLLRTLDAVNEQTARYGYHEHYAVKANANPRILSLIAQKGLGADCVSGGEVQAALDAGFPADRIFFAGVGKADWEIRLGLEHDIACFNVESLAELRVIDELAAARNQTATVALRINPNVDAHTHAKITTGLQENKFGITAGSLPGVLDAMAALTHVRFFGIHFHIGSQITDLPVFHELCLRANELQDELETRGLTVAHLNFGGGLGIDYHHPNRQPVPDFENFFAAFHRLIRLRPGQQIHFELGRSVVGQCGALISRALYVKEGEMKKFAVLDAGFTELIRPAMYDAYHRIENLTSNEAVETYDVVGPICESSDVFARERELNRVRRGDLIAIRSAGAYGEVMASQYNCRRLPEAFFSDLL